MAISAVHKADCVDGGFADREDSRPYCMKRAFGYNRGHAIHLRRGAAMSETILSADDVRAIADLARLELSEDDVALYQRQLSAILDYFQKLEELDTSHIDPTASALPMRTVMRADEADQPLPLDAALANAPDSDGQQFRVRSVLTD